MTDPLPSFVLPPAVLPHVANAKEILASILCQLRGQSVSMDLTSVQLLLSSGNVRVQYNSRFVDGSALASRLLGKSTEALATITDSEVSLLWVGPFDHVYTRRIKCN
jgi:hypothetical protein